MRKERRRAPRRRQSRARELTVQIKSNNGTRLLKLRFSTHAVRRACRHASSFRSATDEIARLSSSESVIFLASSGRHQNIFPPCLAASTNRFCSTEGFVKELFEPCIYFTGSAQSLPNKPLIMNGSTNGFKFEPLDEETLHSGAEG